MSETTIEMLRGMAQQAGLDLKDDELQRLLPGVRRSKKQAAELRNLIGSADEPAGCFSASSARRD